MAAPNQSTSYFPNQTLAVSLAPFDTFSTPWKWGKMRENGVKALKISTNVKCFVVENPAG